jgi:hypothetical protein
MIHRPGKDGQRLTRELVGYDGTMELTQAYEMIDEAGQGSLFYRLVISPDPRTEDAERDLHLSEIIERTMLYLEDRFQRQVQFVAAEHDDHSPNRHTHILAVLPGRLSARDLAALRGVATEAALFQRRGQAPEPIIANLTVADAVTELQLSVHADKATSLVVIEMVRSDGALPAALLVLGRDPALALADALAGAAMPRGLGDEL